MKPPNTDEVHFRELTTSDFEALYSGAFSVPEVTKDLQWDTHKELSQTKELVEEMIEFHQKKTKYFWVVLAPEDKRIVGLGSLKPDNHTVWLGFLICHQEQRKGFGSAVLKALEVSAFHTSEKICAAVDSKNESSRKLLEASGWVKADYISLGKLITYEKYKANKPMQSTTRLSHSRD